MWTGPKGKKNKSATNPITCAWVNPDIFLSDDVKSVSRHNVEGEQSNFPATISLYGACSEEVLVQRSLGYQSESAYHRIRVDGEIFVSGKKKLRSQKYPDTCGRGLNFLHIFYYIFFYYSPTSIKRPPSGL